MFASEYTCITQNSPRTNNGLFVSVPNIHCLNSVNCGQYVSKAVFKWGNDIIFTVYMRLLRDLNIVVFLCNLQSAKCISIL